MRKKETPSGRAAGAGWRGFGLALALAACLAAPAAVRAQGRPSSGAGEAGLSGRIAARDAAGVAQELAAGAFVGQKEVSAALQAGDPAVFGLIAERAATRPQRNDCKLVLELLTKFGTSAAVDKLRVALLQEHLLGDTASVNCTEPIRESLFNKLWTARSSATVPLARTLLQKNLLAANNGLLEEYAKNFYYGLSSGVEDVDRYAILLVTLAESAPSLAGYDTSILLYAIGAAAELRFGDINPPEKHVARTRLVRALLDKGLRLSVAQIEELEQRARNHWTGREQPQALALVAMIRAGHPNLAADERQLRSQRALMAAVKEGLNSRDHSIEGAEGEARIAHQIRRGGNPNRIEHDGDAGFSDRAYGERCQVYTHWLIDRNSLEVAKALVETTRDELINGVEASAQGQAATKGKCGNRWQFHLVEQALWPSREVDRLTGKREPLALYLLEQGLPVKDPQKALVGAAEQGYQQLARALIAKGASLDAAFKQLAERNNERALSVLAAAGDEPGKSLFAARQRDLARRASERAQREAEASAQASKARARRQSEERTRVAALANRKKQVGDAVCMNGSVALGLISVRVRGFVEAVNGSRIQVRVADTGGQSINYQGVSLRQNTVLWDRFDGWLHCGG